VTGQAGIGGEVTCTVDGLSYRVTKYLDYIYPADVRFEGDKGTLWVLTSGLGAGVIDLAILYEYSLETRSGRSLEIDPGNLPPPCPVLR
jgi:hypothetical protein